MDVSYAFILKNMPHDGQVELLHEQFGKITIKYFKNQQARCLSTGSVIACKVISYQKKYRFDFFDILFAPTISSVHHLEFIHELIMICRVLLPTDIMVADILFFILALLPNLDQIEQQSRKIILVQLFILCDILPDDPYLHELSLEKPFAAGLLNHKKLDHYLHFGLSLCKEKSFKAWL